jgi:P27 family predicted phage terminase small subunit
VLTECDRETLAIYCTLAARRAAAEKELTKLGPIVKSPSGYPIVTPHLSVANKCAELMPRYGQELGLTPSGRSRIKTVATAPTDPMADIVAAIAANRSTARPPQATK